MSGGTGWVLKEVLPGRTWMKDGSELDGWHKMIAEARAVMLKDEGHRQLHLEIEVSAHWDWKSDDNFQDTVEAVVSQALDRGRAAAAGFLAAVADPVEEPADPLRVHTIIVNGQSIEVPRRDGDDLLGVAERAGALASYGLITTRPWEIRDDMGSRLGAGDDPDRIRHISLKAGTAS